MPTRASLAVAWLTFATLCAAVGCRREAAPGHPGELPIAHNESAPAMTSTGFSPLRPIVLGHHLLHDSDRDLYRLVDELSGTVWAEGDLEHCSEALVQRLLEQHGSGYPNLTLPTLGARQFWADVHWYAAWRIQENVLSGHHRLLDDHDVRRAWGSRAACRAVLERERLQRGLVPRSEQLVVLLHGLGRDRTVWEPMEQALRDAGYDVAALAYPSTRRSIAEHGSQLDELLAGIEGSREVSFVTHSLGALVLRSALSGDPSWTERLPLRRVVMIAPPSQGSSLAQALSDFLPFAMIAGPSGQELARHDLEALPAPPCSFGIIAAGRGSEAGYNPWLDGDNDGVVAVDETRLAGADDFLLLRGLHTFVMKDPQAIAATLSFLSSGQFGDAADETPPH